MTKWSTQLLPSAARFSGGLVFWSSRAQKRDLAEVVDIYRGGICFFCFQVWPLLSPYVYWLYYLIIVSYVLKCHPLSITTVPLWSFFHLLPFSEASTAIHHKFHHFLGISWETCAVLDNWSGSLLMSLECLLLIHLQRPTRCDDAMISGRPVALKAAWRRSSMGMYGIQPTKSCRIIEDTIYIYVTTQDKTIKPTKKSIPVTSHIQTWFEIPVLNNMLGCTPSNYGCGSNWFRWKSWSWDLKPSNFCVPHDFTSIIGINTINSHGNIHPTSPNLGSDADLLAIWDIWAIPD